jgi:hypothetical protein
VLRCRRRRCAVSVGTPLASKYASGVPCAPNSGARRRRPAHRRYLGSTRWALGAAPWQTRGGGVRGRRSSPAAQVRTGGGPSRARCSASRYDWRTTAPPSSVRPRPSEVVASPVACQHSLRTKSAEGAPGYLHVRRPRLGFSDPDRRALRQGAGEDLATPRSARPERPWHLSYGRRGASHIPMTGALGGPSPGPQQSQPSIGTVAPSAILRPGRLRGNMPKTAGIGERGAFLADDDRADHLCVNTAVILIRARGCELHLPRGSRLERWIAQRGLGVEGDRVHH